MKPEGRLIAFTPQQIKWLKKRAKFLNMTVGEVVRRIIDSKILWDAHESKRFPNGPGFVGMPFDFPPPEEGDMSRM